MKLEDAEKLLKSAQVLLDEANGIMDNVIKEDKESMETATWKVVGSDVINTWKRLYNTFAEEYFKLADSYVRNGMKIGKINSSNEL